MFPEERSGLPFTNLNLYSYREVSLTESIHSHDSESYLHAMKRRYQKAGCFWSVTTNVNCERVNWLMEWWEVPGHVSPSLHGIKRMNWLNGLLWLLLVRECTWVEAFTVASVVIIDGCFDLLQLKKRSSITRTIDEKMYEQLIGSVNWLNLRRFTRVGSVSAPKILFSVLLSTSTTLAALDWLTIGESVEIFLLSLSRDTSAAPPYTVCCLVNCVMLPKIYPSVRWWLLRSDFTKPNRAITFMLLCDGDQ